MIGIILEINGNGDNNIIVPLPSNIALINFKSRPDTTMKEINPDLWDWSREDFSYVCLLDIVLFVLLILFYSDFHYLILFHLDKRYF